MELIDAYVTYSEAQRIIPFLKHMVKHAPYKYMRLTAARLLSELELVRDRDYSPLRGCQIILRSERDRELLLDLITALGDK